MKVKIKKVKNPRVNKELKFLTQENLSTVLIDKVKIKRKFKQEKMLQFILKVMRCIRILRRKTFK